MENYVCMVDTELAKKFILIGSFVSNHEGNSKNAL